MGERVEAVLPESVLRVLRVLAWAALCALVFAFGFFQDALSLKTAIVLGFGAVAIVVLALPYPWAVTVMFGYIALEGMLKVITNWNPVVHIGTELLLFGLCARFVGQAILSRRRILPAELPPLAPLFALHLAWFFVEFANPYSLGLIPSLAGFKVYGSLILIYLFGYYLSNDVVQVRRFMAVWVAILALQVVLSLYQGAVGPQSVISMSANYAAQLKKFEGYAFRPFGTTSGAGGGSTFIFLAFPFLVMFLLSARMALRPLLLALIPATIFALALCQVRAAIAKSILGTAILLALGLKGFSFKSKAKVVTALVAACVVVAFAIPHLTERWTAENADTTRAIERSLSLFDANKARNARAGAWERIVDYSERVPLGAGLSRGGAASNKFMELIRRDPFFPYGLFSDNFWALAIAEIGIPGAFIMTAIVASILIGGLRNWRRLTDPPLILANAAILGMLTASTVGLWGGEGIVYQPELGAFWFFAGVLMRLPNLDSARHQAGVEKRRSLKG